MQTVTRKVNSFRTLTPSERQVLVIASILLPILWLGLQMAGFARFNRWLGGSPSLSEARLASNEAAMIGRIVNIAASQTPAPVSCLTRSLVLRWMLRRRNIASDLRIGVRLVDGTLDAHAWVECNGKPINDSADVAERYAAFGGPLSAEAFSTP